MLIERIEMDFGADTCAEEVLHPFSQHSIANDWDDVPTDAFAVLHCRNHYAKWWFSYGEPGRYLKFVIETIALLEILPQNMRLIVIEPNSNLYFPTDKFYEETNFWHTDEYDGARVYEEIVYEEMRYATVGKLRTDLTDFLIAFEQPPVVDQKIREF